MLARKVFDTGVLPGGGGGGGGSAIFQESLERAANLRDVANELCILRDDPP